MLIGVWAPKKWDYPLSTLKQYTMTPIPRENPWITRPRSTTPTPAPAPVTMAADGEPIVKARRKLRPHSGRVMRHVLRARAEAARALASLFHELERAPMDKHVCASAHLARLYGGGVDEVAQAVMAAAAVLAEDNAVVVPARPTGWRYAREVVAFLKQRGARIASLERRVEGDWAALSSDGETTPAEDSDTGTDKEKEPLVFVPRGH